MPGRGSVARKRNDPRNNGPVATIFQDSHLPLITWFRAMWYICVQKNGASALGLQRALGLGSYRTAWLCLHKLRRAMVRSGREKLSGEVEVDEMYVGGARFLSKLILSHFSKTQSTSLIPVNMPIWKSISSSLLCIGLNLSSEKTSRTLSISLRYKRFLPCFCA